MKAYLKVYYLAAFAGALLPFSVGAATLNVSQNTTLILPSTGDSYTIDSGSSAESISASGGTITIIITGGEHVTLESANKRQFSNSANTTWDCNTNVSSITFSQDVTNTTSTTITVTPSSSCSSGSSGGSGGGGVISGGGGSSAPSVPAQAGIPAPAAAASAPAVASAPASSVAHPSPAAEAVSPVFNRDLVRGGKSKDVSRLQALLASDKSLYPEGIISGYFGALTKAAVARFQKKFGLPQVGRVGPLTRKKLAEVFGGKSEAAPVIQAPVPVPTPAPAPKTITPAPVAPAPSSSAIPWFLQLTPAPKPQ